MGSSDKMKAHVFFITVAAFSWGALIWFPLPSCAFGPPSIEANNDGLKNYKGEDYREAFSDFASALAKDPFNPYYHLNLGDTFFKGGEYDKAFSEFEAVEKNPKASSDLKYQAMFNAGNVAVEAKNIPKALEFYQRALQYKPDSVETKTNIELALKEQQGGGSGKQDQKNNSGQDKKNEQGDSKKDQQNQQAQNNQGPQQTPKPTPQGFKSENLSEGDVRRILEELKRQEQEIRAKQYTNKKTPERPIEKDW